MAWVSVLRPGEGEQHQERELERGRGRGRWREGRPLDRGRAQFLWDADGQRGRKRSSKGPPHPGQEPAGPCERAGQTLPAHKAQAAARHNESQMSTGLVSGLPPPPSLGVALAAKDWSCGWMRAGELAWPCHPPAKLRRNLPGPQFPHQELPLPSSSPHAGHGDMLYPWANTHLGPA